MFHNFCFIFWCFAAFLILSLASLVYSCYSTFVYQAGITSIINRQFRLPVLITFLYIVLSICLHVLSSVYTAADGAWSKAIQALFVVQKLCKFSTLNKFRYFHSSFLGCPVNFYFFKRSVLVISDPRFYENFEWINQQLKEK